MIHSLTGTVLDIHKDSIILDNGHNWSFTIFVRDCDRVQGFVGRIYVHFHLRQDHVSLFGFQDEQACRLFKVLIGVKGCGPKTAMNILNKCSISDLVVAIQTQQEWRLQQLPGIGKRMASQLILDLKGKLEGFEDLNTRPSYLLGVIDSLVSLGYGRNHCEKVSHHISASQHHDESSYLKLMLQGLKETST